MADISHVADQSGESCNKDEKRVGDSGKLVMFRSSSDPESLTKEIGEVQDVFGNEEGNDVHYKTMTWVQGAFVMLAENISLGILSLPAVLSTVGLVGGLIALIALGILSTYSGYVLWQFKMRHPYINNYGDLGGVLLGRPGAIIFGIAYIVYCVFCMASHLLTFTIAMNVLTGHAICTILWGIVGVVVFALLTIPRTLKGVSWLSIISFLSILSAVMLTMIALGVSPRTIDDVMQATNTPNFPTAFNSISNIVFAYAGHVGWVAFISELRKPQDFPKALLTQQALMIILYTTVALVIYRYAGADVASPALNSNTELVKKIAWGIALPTIVIAGVIFAHILVKYTFLKAFAGTRHLGSSGPIATTSWIGIGFLMWTAAFLIAESIPVFSDLLGFISALFASWFSYGVPGCLWFVMNWKRADRHVNAEGVHGRGNEQGEKEDGRIESRGKWWALAFVNALLVVVGCIIFAAGLYASGWSMAKDSGAGAAWSCADNS